MQLQPESPPEPKVEDDGPETFSGADEWEDVPDADSEATSQRELASSASDSQAASTVFLRKRRRILTNTTSAAPPTPSRSHSAKPRRKKVIVSKEEAQEALTGGGRFIASYAFDVVKGSIEMMRKPLSWFLFVWIFAWVVSRMTNTFRTAFSPLCIVPGISRSTLCIPAQPPVTVNFPELLNIQGSTFEQLLGESAANSELSVGVLKAEMATRDLSLLVRFSDLNSKDSIANTLDTVALDAKKTGRGLSKLNAKVVGGIDQVMALNNYAMATIEGAHRKAPSPLLQAISPFKLGPTADEIITTAFTLAMDQSAQTIEKLVLEAEGSRQDLEQMDVDLMTLYEITTRESKPIAEEKEKVLGELWTKLGGNQKSVREYGDRLELLNDLEEYRKKALAHVTATSRALDWMSNDLEVLRDRVAAPALLEGKVPLHVHIEGIKNGLERLREGQTRSRAGQIGDENV
ncbi:hypothetical protein BDN67DRAFT_990474 [Paxillus ammoniavirescens]|nr:hypothetical protein BDN67DRAFT_990474 [Paxillus ammoniavirescens]